MKIPEGLNALKAEAETLNRKLDDLDEEELKEVNGGTLGPGYWDSCPYQIRLGDCLSVLAQKFKTTVRHIMDMNPKIQDPDKIFGGDWINMPYPDHE